MRTHKVFGWMRMGLLALGLTVLAPSQAKAQGFLANAFSGLSSMFQTGRANGFPRVMQGLGLAQGILGMIPGVGPLAPAILGAVQQGVPALGQGGGLNMAANITGLSLANAQANPGAAGSPYAVPQQMTGQPTGNGGGGIYTGATSGTYNGP